MKKKLLCIMMALILALSALVMAGCTDKKEEGSSVDSLQAADPMTEEELANDDSGGCIEDSEDLLN